MRSVLNADLNAGQLKQPIGRSLKAMIRLHFMKKVLAIVGVRDNIAAVRHDLPHMPSLGVSSLDSWPPQGGFLFWR
jgi:hypothetical protein